MAQGSLRHVGKAEGGEGGEGGDSTCDGRAHTLEGNLRFSTWMGAELTLGIHRTPEALNDEPTISHLDGGGRSDPSETAWPPSSLRMRGDGLRRGETQHQPSRHVWREHRPVELRRFEPGAVVVEATACPFRRGAPTRSLRAQPGSDAIIDDFARLVDDSNATSLVPNCSEACAQCA